MPMHIESDENAEVIAKDLLEITGTALLTGNFELLHSCFALPLTLNTIYGQKTLETRDELRATVEAVTRHMFETGVVDLVRTVMLSRFEDRNTITSVHICSEVNRGGIVNRPTYPVYSTLVRVDSRWRIAFCRYLIFDRLEHNLALVGDSRSIGAGLN